MQTAAKCLGLDGVPVKDGSFSSLVKPYGCINDAISKMTGINNEKVQSADNFSTVGRNFIQFIQEHCCENNKN